MEMPLKFKVLEPETVTNATITGILENAAIDYHYNGGVYVTSYGINFWLDVDQKRKLLILYTYWTTLPNVDEIEILRFANQANTDKIMLQFSYHPESARFYAHYTHTFSVGLIEQQVLKIAQHFSSIFEDVVQQGTKDGILVPLSEWHEDDADEAVEPVTASTVH
jgi:hypothetical protein